jgi:site-specific DNA-methyltransferase (adenine-specific)
MAQLKPVLRTKLGFLYEADCMAVLPTLKKESVDTVFADPPFNLKKKYGRKTSDDLLDAQYLAWCRSWLDECVRVLKPGGALFLYNLPKWNLPLGAYLNASLSFRHWIAVEQKNGLPIQGRLYPAHYSLLYFTKGKPNTFRSIRTPIEVCRHCGGEIKDYGGHRDAMNPKGVNLKDVWTDIPPVRHRKFKSDKRPANALSTKLLERVVELSTRPGDMVLDPFGGSGTTYAVCEQRHRHWIGIEIENPQSIIDRLNGDVDHHRNDDFIEVAPRALSHVAAV